MVNRAPGTVWALRKDTYGPYVMTGEGDTIKVVFPDGDGYAYVHALSRKDARLLAKRMNQCLDSTRKK